MTAEILMTNLISIKMSSLLNGTIILPTMMTRDPQLTKISILKPMIPKQEKEATKNMTQMPPTDLPTHRESLMILTPPEVKRASLNLKRRKKKKSPKRKRNDAHQGKHPRKKPKRNGLDPNDPLQPISFSWLPNEKISKKTIK